MNRRLSILFGFGACVSCRICVPFGCVFVHVPRGTWEEGRMCSGVQYERTWVIGHVVFFLFVFMLFILVFLVDVVCVVCCACLCLQLHPVCGLFGVFGVSAFHVCVLRVHESSLFVIAAWFGDGSGDWLAA